MSNYNSDCYKLSDIQAMNFYSGPSAERNNNNNLFTGPSVEQNNIYSGPSVEQLAHEYAT